MQKANLIIAIIYTIILVWLFLAGVAENDWDMAIGAVMLSGPIVVNWMTYSYLKKITK